MSETHTCTTSTAFEAYGVRDGAELLRRTHARMDERTSDRTDDPERIDEGTFDRLEAGFRTAFGELSGAGTVPPLVEAALEDGRYFVRERYDGTSVDVRTELVPAFYREVAGFHCAFRGH